MPRGRARASQNRQVSARCSPRGQSAIPNATEAVQGHTVPLVGGADIVIPRVDEIGQGPRIITPTANIDPSKSIGIYRGRHELIDVIQC